MLEPHPEFSLLPGSRLLPSASDVLWSSPAKTRPVSPGNTRRVCPAHRERVCCPHGAGHKAPCRISDCKRSVGHRNARAGRKELSCLLSHACRRCSRAPCTAIPEDTSQPWGQPGICDKSPCVGMSLLKAFLQPSSTSRAVFHMHVHAYMHAQAGKAPAG